MSKAKYWLSSPSICFLCRVSFMEAGQEITWKKFGTIATSLSRADTGHTDPGYSETERKTAGTDASFWSVNVCVFFYRYTCRPC